MTFPAAGNSHLVRELLVLFVDRRTWSPPAMRGARVWQASLAEHLHKAARLEDLARRGGPRNAREYSEREWDRQTLDREVLEANVIAWNTHRADLLTKRRPAQRARKKRLTRWEYALQLQLEAAGE